jgi:hypothetical protein
MEKSENELLKGQLALRDQEILLLKKAVADL